MIQSKQNYSWPTANDTECADHSSPDHTLLWAALVGISMTGLEREWTVAEHGWDEVLFIVLSSLTSSALKLGRATVDISLNSALSDCTNDGSLLAATMLSLTAWCVALLSASFFCGSVSLPVSHAVIMFVVFMHVCCVIFHKVSVSVSVNTYVIAHRYVNLKATMSERGP